MEQATRHAALIVSHGSPSAPEGPEGDMRALGASVEALLPGGWTVRGVTLAALGALEAALIELPEDSRLLVYPHFMADGWFTTEELPRRLHRAGEVDPVILPAFGLDPAVSRLCLVAAQAALAELGCAPGVAALLLVAHGSPSDPRPANAARTAMRVLQASGCFREVRVGFVDQSPHIAEAARLAAPALCLPFFAGRAGHVETDVPQALAEAKFPGPTLDPVGTRPEVPAIIAGALLGKATTQTTGALSVIANGSARANRNRTFGIAQPAGLPALKP
jgi:sirohydrochlorin ferrochelatase